MLRHAGSLGVSTDCWPHKTPWSINTPNARHAAAAQNGTVRPKDSIKIMFTFVMSEFEGELRASARAPSYFMPNSDLHDVTPKKVSIAVACASAAKTAHYHALPTPSALHMQLCTSSAHAAPSTHAHMHRLQHAAR